MSSSRLVSFHQCPDVRTCSHVGVRTEVAAVIACLLPPLPLPVGRHCLWHRVRQGFECFDGTGAAPRAKGVCLGAHCRCYRHVLIAILDELRRMTSLGMNSEITCRNELESHH